MKGYYCDSRMKSNTNSPKTINAVRFNNRYFDPQTVKTWAKMAASVGVATVVIVVSYIFLF